MKHEVKIKSQYFNDIISGEKNFEIRKNDRDYRVGDILILQEYDNGEYTKNFVRRKIAYIHHGDGNFGLEKGYCVLGLSKCE